MGGDDQGESLQKVSRIKEEISSNIEPVVTHYEKTKVFIFHPEKWSFLKYNGILLRTF